MSKILTKIAFGTCNDELQNKLFILQMSTSPSSLPNESGFPSVPSPPCRDTPSASLTVEKSKEPVVSTGNVKEKDHLKNINYWDTKSCDCHEYEISGDCYCNF